MLNRSAIVLVVDSIPECLRFEPFPAAIVAGSIASITRRKDSHMHLVLVSIEPSEEAIQTAKVTFRYAALNQPKVLLLEFPERDIDGNVVIVRQRKQFVEFVSIGGRRPRCDRTLGQ